MPAYQGGGTALVLGNRFGLGAKGLIVKLATKFTAVALFATAGVAVVATPAVAYPGNCVVRDVTNEAFAVCSSGSGYYQAATQCDAPWYKLNYRRLGSVETIGYYSWATCDAGDDAYNPVAIIHG